MQLFGCEFRGGRPGEAPQLKRVVEPDALGELNGLYVENGEYAPHDPNVLPHHYSPADLEDLFPMATVPECDEIGDEERAEAAAWTRDAAAARNTSTSSSGTTRFSSGAASATGAASSIATSAASVAARAGSATSPPRVQGRRQLERAQQ